MLFITLLVCIVILNGGQTHGIVAIVAGFSLQIVYFGVVKKKKQPYYFLRKS